MLDHRRTQLELGLSKEEAPTFNAQAESLQDEFEKLERWKQNRFVSITEAGHGIRSMIKLLTSLLEPVNQVILIDEPEMHLYPSQKRWLRRQLVNLAGEQKKQVFVVTHDPMVLQGIFDANKKTSIFRVDKTEDGKGSIKVCEFNKVDVGHAKNQEQYLQSLFYQRCIVVEGASDRSFYQQLFEDYAAVEDKDLGVVVAGGVGNSKHIAELGAKIGLRNATIWMFSSKTSR
jgi:predicted ATP-dependent endonuclease of OLD family